MVQKHYCWLIILLICTLTGCSRTPLRVYTVYEEDLDSAIVYHENALYKYDKTTGQVGEVINTAHDDQIIPDLSTYGEEYSLKHKNLSQYTGSLCDAAAYSNYLQTKDYSITKLSYKSNYLDITLSNSEEHIRVLYLGSDIVRIFYANTKNKNYFPPYINEKGSE